MNNFTSLMQAYLLLLKGNRIEAENILKESTSDVLNTEGIPEKALWLYVCTLLAEDSNVTYSEMGWENTYRDCIAFLTEHWSDSAADLWGESKDQVHMSNLGMIYGALLAAKRFTGKTIIQKTLTEVRDFVFDHGLSGGKLIRFPGNKQVSIDLLATVMPFGLFSPEDLVMVEAVKDMEQHLVLDGAIYRYRGDKKACPVSTAWLSWYFTEKGDVKKARYYLSLCHKIIDAYLKDGDKQTVTLARTIGDISEFFLAKAASKEQGLQIIHTPYGNDNPYERLRTERVPRDPAVGENIKARAQIWPEQTDIQMYVRVEVSEDKKEIPCHLKKIDGEYVWEASIKELSSPAKIDYTFVARDENGKETFSEVFTFWPARTNHFQSISVAKVAGDTLWVSGADDLSEQLVYLGIKNSGGGLQFQVRIGDTPDVFLEAPDSLNSSKIACTENRENIVANFSDWTCELNKNPVQMKVFDKNGKMLLRSYNDLFPLLEWQTTGNGEVRNITWNFCSELDERFYGFGERYNKLEQRGENLDCYVYNQYRDQGSRTYIPIPYFISNKGYGIWLDTSHYSRFDLADEFSDLIKISANIDPEEPELDLVMWQGEPKEICQVFTQKTGKPVLPPVWAFGPWMSSNNWDRDEIVRKQVALTNRHQIPATVLVLEQWSDETTYYIFNDAEYELKPGEESHSYHEFEFPEWGRWPNPKGLTDYIHENGMKLILWQIPIQKYLNQQKHLQKDEDERVMLEKGYTVKHEDGTPYRMPEGWFKESLLMDFSNDEGSKWWFDKRQYLLDIGVDGFKTDGGEFVFGRILRFADGRTGSEMRNEYPNDYIEAYYHFANNFHKGNAMTFSRAGYTGAQKFPAHWAGDERSTFDAFRHSLIAGLTSGMSGIPFWGWDLAGFNGDIPTAELFIRSAQMAAFCPIMQYHAESKAEFNQDRTPWNIADRTGDDRALEQYRYYANVRMNLLPYIYDQARKSSETGVPLMKAMLLEYPNDVRCHTLYDQYLFGEDLLVAPVIEEGAEERMVYFPEGTWVNLWSNKIVNGPAWEREKATLTEIPVYVKEGAAVLLNCDSTNRLGSWVGNDIDRFKTPTLCFYPTEKGINRTIHDHLDKKWHVNVEKSNNDWDVNIETQEKGAMALVPTNLLGSGERLKVNGKLLSEKELEVGDDFYIFSLN